MTTITFNASAYGLEENLTDCFSVACALYWYCADYHPGGGSREYQILGLLDYHPSPTEYGPEEDTTDRMIYEDLAVGMLDVESVYQWFEKAYAVYAVAKAAEE